jgi:prepilin-type N-terminal cleavage/methylation domain-containing protein
MVTSFFQNKKSGFTLVELLVVMVIMAILVAISLVAYDSYQDRAKYEKAKHEITQLVDAIKVARTNKGGATLPSITGNGCPGNATCDEVAATIYCYGSADGGKNTNNTEPKLLPKNGPCWTGYIDALDKITQASGSNLDGLKKGDPYGNPYMIEENESEFHEDYPCVRDIVSMFVPGSAFYYQHNPPQPVSVNPNYNWIPPDWMVPNGSGNVPTTINGVSIVDTYKLQIYIPMVKAHPSC